MVVCNDRIRIKRSDLANRVIGPLDRYCVGCPFDPKSAYVTAPIIGIGCISSTDRTNLEPLDRTIAFDRAECDTANLSQINMVTVSSFNGPQGLLLGYDLLRNRAVPHPLIADPAVFDAGALFTATHSLLGTVSHERFPIAPGQHVLCAAKQYFAEGPATIYGAMAVAIANNRDENADLFMECHGILRHGPNETTADPKGEQSVLSKVVDSVRAIGDNLGVIYREIFVGLRSRFVEKGELGCVLTAAPYIHLARNAVPRNRPELLLEMSCKEWEAEVLQKV